MSYYDYYQPEAYVPPRTCTSRKTPISTKKSTSCATRRRRRCSSGGTWSSWPRYPASTAWATGGVPELCPDVLQRPDYSAGTCCAGWWICSTSATTSISRQVPCAGRYAGDPAGLRGVDAPHRVLRRRHGAHHQVDPLTGEIMDELDKVEIFPAKHFVAPQEK